MPFNRSACFGTPSVFYALGVTIHCCTHLRGVRSAAKRSTQSTLIQRNPTDCPRHKAATAGGGLQPEVQRASIAFLISAFSSGSGNAGPEVAFGYASNNFSAPARQRNYPTRTLITCATGFGSRPQFYQTTVARIKSADRAHPRKFDDASLQNLTNSASHSPRAHGLDPARMRKG